MQRGAARSEFERGLQVSILCPRQDSNLRFYLRRVALYPLSYGGLTALIQHRSAVGKRCLLTVENAISRAGAPEQESGQAGGGSGLAPRSRSNCSISTISALWPVAIFWAALRT
jgi:hypothetical protein